MKKNHSNQEIKQLIGASINNYMDPQNNNQNQDQNTLNTNQQNQKQLNTNNSQKSNQIQEEEKLQVVQNQQNLEILDLNSFQIPEQEFFDLVQEYPNLKKINLSYNSLQNIPILPTKLEFLAVNNNLLTIVSPSILKLNGLVLLDFSNNYLTDLNQFNFSQLENLKYMFLRNNQLDQISNLSSQLPQLLELDLQGNKISDIKQIEAFNQSQNLEILNCRDNQIIKYIQNFELQLDNFPYLINDILTISKFSLESSKIFFNLQKNFNENIESIIFLKQSPSHNTSQELKPKQKQNQIQKQHKEDDIVKEESYFLKLRNSTKNILQQQKQKLQSQQQGAKTQRNPSPKVKLYLSPQSLRNKYIEQKVNVKHKNNRSEGGNNFSNSSHANNLSKKIKSIKQNKNSMSKKGNLTVGAVQNNSQFSFDNSGVNTTVANDYNGVKNINNINLTKEQIKMNSSKEDNENNQNQKFTNNHFIKGSNGFNKKNKSEANLANLQSNKSECLKQEYGISLEKKGLNKSTSELKKKGIHDLKNNFNNKFQQFNTDISQCVTERGTTRHSKSPKSVKTSKPVNFKQFKQKLNEMEQFDSIYNENQQLKKINNELQDKIKEQELELNNKQQQFQELQQLKQINQKFTAQMQDIEYKWAETKSINETLFEENKNLVEQIFKIQQIVAQSNNFAHQTPIEILKNLRGFITQAMKMKINQQKQNEEIKHNLMKELQVITLKYNNFESEAYFKISRLANKYQNLFSKFSILAEKYKKLSKININITNHQNLSGQIKSYENAEFSQNNTSDSTNGENSSVSQQQQQQQQQQQLQQTLLITPQTTKDKDLYNKNHKNINQVSQFNENINYSQKNEMKSASPTVEKSKLLVDKKVVNYIEKLKAKIKSLEVDIYFYKNKYQQYKQALEIIQHQQHLQELENQQYEVDENFVEQDNFGSQEIQYNQDLSEIKECSYSQENSNIF